MQQARKWGHFFLENCRNSESVQGRWKNFFSTKSTIEDRRLKFVFNIAVLQRVETRRKIVNRTTTFFHINFTSSRDFFPFTTTPNIQIQLCQLRTARTISEKAILHPRTSNNRSRQVDRKKKRKEKKNKKPKNVVNHSY